jgi:hypothetical protein
LRHIFRLGRNLRYIKILALVGIILVDMIQLEEYGVRDNGVEDGVLSGIFFFLRRKRCWERNLKKSQKLGLEFKNQIIGREWKEERV